MPTTNFSTLLYTIGVLFAIILGIGSAANATWTQANWIPIVLILLGLIVGFNNITAKEVTPFLIGTLALIVTLQIAQLHLLDQLIPKIGTFLTETIRYFVTIIATAAVVVSFRAVYHLAK